MVELAVLAGWIGLWFWPRWSLLNKMGLLLLFLMLPSAAITYVLASDWFRTIIILWSIYLVTFLALGSMCIVWRTRQDSGLAKQSRNPVGSWAPAVAKSLLGILPFFAGLAAVGFVLMLLLGVDLRSALFVGLLTTGGPLILLGYVWLATLVVDFATNSHKTDAD
jgi:hypothetical protein